MRFGVVIFPGSNCDHDCYYAIQSVIGKPVEFIWHQDTDLEGFDAIILPGGFSYGDYLRAGAIARFSPVMGAVREFAVKGGLVIGICNGFQVLVKAGFLPWSSNGSEQQLTLTENDSGRFECRWVYTTVDREGPCIFTKGIERLYLPVAHGEGKVVVAPETIPRLYAVLYYTDEQGNTDAGYPYNPNGSVKNIAGICDDSGRIFALMPHPERHIRGTQHPQWTRLGAREYGDGFQIFLNAVRWVEKS